MRKADSEETRRLFEAWEKEGCPDASCPCHFGNRGAEAPVSDRYALWAVAGLTVLWCIIALLLAAQFGRL